MAKTPELTLKTTFIAEEPKRAQVGDVVQSMLTEIQFQTERDSTWVLMDGRDITSTNPLYSVDTEYFNITGNATIPDARGRTLRMQNNGTTVNPDGTALGANQGHQYASHNHSAIGHNAAGAFTISGPNDFLLANPFSGGTRFVNSNGGNETRMVNTTVNFFIKIN